MMKNVLIINGHPDSNSYNHALAKAYRSGAGNNKAVIDQIDIGSLKFNPNLQHGYSKKMELEPDLVVAIDKIKEADHLVWVFPMWWYGYPAIMKGFIDRTFLPNITFKFMEGKPLPQKLLKGKTARIIVTADTPWWYNYFYMKSPAINQLKKGTLEFCGVKPVKTTFIAPIKGSTPEFRANWLNKVALLGQKLL